MPLGTPVLPAVHWATFPHQPSSVPRARRLLRGVLDEAGVDETTTAEIEVVLSEIVGNAVRHARPLHDGDIAVECRLLPGGDCAGRHIEIAVSDGGGSTQVVRRRAGHGDTGGRGLLIVDDLAHEWGVIEDLDDFTRTVWASFGGARDRELPPPAGA